MELKIFKKALFDLLLLIGAKGDWDSRIFDLVKNPDGADI